MKSKFSEVELNQIIIEEATKVVKDKEQLDENVGLAGALIAGAGYFGFNEFMDYMRPEPEYDVILKQAMEDDREEVEEKMRDYFRAFKRMMSNASLFSFAPTSVAGRAVEYLPTLNFGPNRPSKDAERRQEDLLNKVNVVIKRHNPVSLQPLNDEELKTRLQNLMRSFIKKEFGIAEEYGFVDRMPKGYKQANLAYDFLKTHINSVVKRALAANETARGVAQAQTTAPPEDTTTTTTPPEETGDQTATGAAPAATSRYTSTDVTPQQVRDGTAEVNPYDKGNVVGYVQGLLQRLGAKIKVDNFFGPNTIDAVNRFKDGLLNEQKETAVVDSDVLKKMELAAEDQEIEDISKGEILPPKTSAGEGEVSEEEADAVPTTALARKAKKLKAKIDKGDVQNKKRASARLDRMNKRLAAKQQRVAAKKPKKGDKKMNEEIDEATLRNIIQEELSEITSPDMDVTGPALVRMIVFFVKKHIYDIILQWSASRFKAKMSRAKSYATRGRDKPKLDYFLAMFKPAYQRLKASLMAGPTADCDDLASGIQDFFVDTAEALQQMLKDRYHTAETYEEARMAHRALKTQLNKYYSGMCSRKEKPPQEIEFDPVVVTPDPKPSTGACASYRSTNLKMADIAAGRGVLKQCMKGAVVKNLQGLLKMSNQDGLYGPATKRAVMKLQKDNGLKVDGIFGKNSYGALIKVPPIPVSSDLPGAPSATAKFGISETKDETVVSESVKDRWQKLIKG